MVSVDAGEARQAGAIEQLDDRRQRERQDDAERERQQDRFRGPQHGDDQHESQQRHPDAVDSHSGLTRRHDQNLRRAWRYADLR